MKTLPFALLATAAAAEPTVTLPLSEYEKLREERPAVTVVDTLRLGGSFRGRDLTATFQGRASGKLAAEMVLSAPPGVRLYGCEGEALVSRSGSAGFTLTPLAPRFTARCRLASTGSDRLEMTATAAVLWVESQIQDGEFVGQDDNAGQRSFSVVRVMGTSGEMLKPTATARYRLTLQPEETVFRYQLEVRNPNRAHQSFDVKLASGEHIQQVDARATYEIEGGRYRFDLPPGESTVLLTGTLSGAEFAPPVDAAVQYLLLESHPLLRPEVTRAARRVGTAEVGVAAQYRGAQAFLLGKDESLAWKTTRLEALRATSFAVRSVDHVFFVSADGKALGESAVALDNQGAPDLSLPMKAEPTFASLAGETVFLTRNAEGNLWLPLAHGEQELVVQHRQPLRRSLGWAAGGLWLPQLAVPSTRSSVEVRYPEEWMPIYEELAPETRIASPDGETVFWALILLLWAERALALLGVAGRRRLAIGAALAVAAVASGEVMALGFVTAGVVTAAWIVAALRKARWTPGRIVAVVAAGVVALLLVFAWGASQIRFQARSAGSGEMAASYARKAAEAPEEAEPAPQAAGPQYQGLPAKFELPSGATRTTFYREMLATETPRAVRVVLLTQGAVALVRAVLALVVLALLILTWRQLTAGGKALLGRALGPAAEPGKAA